jgi:putative SOS response-associated peptidase YedK
MCGRYAIAGPDPSQLRSRFPVGESVEIRRRFNVAPTDEVLTVTTTREGEPRGELLRWGLVPHWAKDPGLGAKMINARAETVAEKPAFRDAFARRRCLIVADGFYEWQRREGARPQPMWITRADGAPFAFAGVWAIWHGPDERVLRTCSIVTTRANDALAPIHDRMPVILAPETEADWLDPAAPPELLHELLAPAPDREVAWRPVGFAVNDVRNDTPECLAPPEPEEQAATGAPDAPTLF